MNFLSDIERRINTVSSSAGNQTLSIRSLNEEVSVNILHKRNKISQSTNKFPKRIYNFEEFLNLLTKEKKPPSKNIKSLKKSSKNLR